MARHQSLLLLGFAALGGVAIWLVLDTRTSESASASGITHQEATARPRAAIAAASPPALSTFARRTPSHPRDVFQRRLQAVAEAAGGQPLTPADARKAMVDALASTGSSSEPWTATATATFSKLSEELSVGDDNGIRVSSVKCFAAGCMATLDYPGSAGFVGFSQRLPNTKSIMDWPGGKLLLQPEQRSNGESAGEFVLLRPDID